MNAFPKSGERRGVLVTAVAAGSPAEAAGLRAGDRIVAVGTECVDDLLDFHFLTGKARFRLAWETPDGTRRTRWVRPAGAPLGVLPEPIRVRRCRNRCIFCFVHQLPKGLRRSLYIKDEDVRLSFLHGQYVTLTDVTDEEIRKIEEYRLSPLYVSIHTTDPVLRGRMLGRPGPAPILPTLERLARKRIGLRGQIVVCPGWNDGGELLRTLGDLSLLRPSLGSVAVVPVGLTSHRQGLPSIRPVSPADARETLRALRVLDAELGRDAGGVFASPADEYFLLAGAPIPERRYYGDFPQIENGVGLLRTFIDQERTLFRRQGRPTIREGGTVVSGTAPGRFVAAFLERVSRKSGKRFRHLAVRNRFLGETVTVTGLLAGRDIIDAVDARGGKDALFLPSVVLRDAGDVTLDGLSPADIERETGRRTVVFEPTPRGFLAAAGEKVL